VLSSRQFRRGNFAGRRWEPRSGALGRHAPSAMPTPRVGTNVSAQIQTAGGVEAKAGLHTSVRVVLVRFFGGGAVVLLGLVLVLSASTWPNRSEKVVLRQRTESVHFDWESVNSSASDAAVVQRVLELGNAGESRQGRPHRSLICTITRNDPHLREYVVRNLLAGFGHIVVYDNNQVRSQSDHNLIPLAAVSHHTPTSRRSFRLMAGAQGHRL
jgi:hypothetical protein